MAGGPKTRGDEEMEILSTEEIETLNVKARYLAEHDYGPVGAMQAAATMADLEPIAEDKSGSWTVIYQGKDGRIVNAWFSGHTTDERIEEGGLGFDDQVEWYTEANA